MLAIARSGKPSSPNVLEQGCTTSLGIWATWEIDFKLAGRTTPGHHECFINVISYLAVL